MGGSCEESSDAGHGYAFLTRIGDDGLQKPRRIDSWGRLHREAVVVDETTGIAYMTEDRYDGCFYRHVPKDPKQPLGAGRLQALKIAGVPTTDPYPEPKPGVATQSKWKTDQTWSVSWVDIADPQATKEPCRDQGIARGATQFMRGEGIAWDGKTVWFTASLGDLKKRAGFFSIYQTPKKFSPGPAHLALRSD